MQGFEEGRGMRGRGRGKVEVGGRQGGVCDGGVLRRVTPGSSYWDWGWNY